MNKTERKIWYITGIEFFLVFLLCAAILTGYDTLRNKRLGADALKQKQNYTYEMLLGKDQEEAKMQMRMLNNSAKDNFDGNFEKQYYSYRIWTEQGQDVFATQDIMIFPAQSEGKIGQIEMRLEDIFSKEECRIIYQACEENTDQNVPPAYRFLYEAGIDENGTYHISKIILEQLTWIKSTDQTEQKSKADPWLHITRSWKSTKEDTRYLQIEAKAVLRWEADGIELTTAEYFDNMSLVLPYLQDSYKDWQQWSKNAWLQEEISFQDIEKEFVKEESSDIFWVEGTAMQKGEARYVVWVAGENYTIQIRSAGYPLLLAMENLKWTYLVLFLILVICTSFVGVQQIRTERRNVQIEKERLDFVNGMAHEVKTPLAVLKMCGDNLRVPGLEFKADYYLETIDQKTAEINELIRRMMYLSQMNSRHFSLSMKETSINGLITQAVAQQKPFIEEKEIRLKRKEQEVIWEVDSAYFGQLISCLLTNAVNYSKKQGNIVIELEGSYFAIENEGAQITEEERFHIFELFYHSEAKEDSTIRSTGFGLYLVSQVAKLHHMECVIENGILGPKFVIKR